MGCNCKTSAKKEEILDNRPMRVKIMHYVLKTLAFLIMVALLPLINLYLIYFMFKTLVLNKEIDIKPLLISIGKKFKESEEEDEEDFESLTTDDVEMLDVEDITVK